MASHAEFAPRLLAWFDRCGRHDLPWQHPRTPYRVWLSEIMLQQTQVRTVIPYFERFVAALPTLESLAQADPDTVLGLWSGLGYYTRARNLHATARLCMERHGGELPRDVAALAALPGIGPSTAAAIAAQAWDAPEAILDGNVKRVLSRYHGVEGWPGLPRVERELWRLARAHVGFAPHARMADYTQAQMDLGATICTRARPACAICPLQEDCVARITGRVDELPTPRPPRVTPQREAAVLLVHQPGRVLLRQRGESGVWATLWALPQFEDAVARAAWLATHVVAEADAVALPPMEHAFTHYRLTLHPLAVRGQLSPGVDAPNLRWIDALEAGKLGIPAPMRRMIESYLEA